MCAKSLQSCLTLCNPMDYSLPAFSVHGISQARILKWVAVSFSRGSSQLVDGAPVCVSSASACWFSTTSATWETHANFQTLLNFDKVDQLPNPL